jgi:integration host factor subunit beta
VPAGSRMIKSELVRRVAADNPSLKLRDVEHLVDTIFNAMADQLAAGGRVELRGFAAFSTRPRSGHTGRNPRTGEAVVVGPKRAPCFKPGIELRALVDKPS